MIRRRLLRCGILLEDRVEQLIEEERFADAMVVARELDWQREEIRKDRA